MSYKKTFTGGVIAFIIATSCCWMPALIVAIGGGSTAMAISNGLGNLSIAFFILGLGLVALGTYKFISRKTTSVNNNLVLLSVICCPKCGHEKEEIMPTKACQYFYECENCKTILKPKGNDCCVYCSYGTVACPPIQLNKDCC